MTFIIENNIQSINLKEIRKKAIQVEIKSMC